MVEEAELRQVESQSHLLARPGVAEAFLLSTCNRTEIYVQPRDEEEAYRAALELTFLRRVQEMEKPGRLYVKRNDEAARHLLGVASGLESMVLGEPEILGQVKQATDHGAAGILFVNSPYSTSQPKAKDENRWREIWSQTSESRTDTDNR